MDVMINTLSIGLSGIICVAVAYVLLRPFITGGAYTNLGAAAVEDPMREFVDELEDLQLKNESGLIDDEELHVAREEVLRDAASKQRASDNQS